MAKSLQEQLIDIAPFAQVLFAVGSGFVLVAGSLPEAEFEKALGPATLYGGKVSYQDFGGFTRFVPTLFTAVLRGPQEVVTFFSLLLAAGAAILLSRNATDSESSPDPIASSRLKWL